MSIGTLALLTGGRGKLHTGVLEFHGGAAKFLLDRAPIGGPAMAITFGHVVLGQTQAALDISRDHERIHVRQYERWGPFFIPAYTFFSVKLWFQGKNAYRDNPFEIEAYNNSELG